MPTAPKPASVTVKLDRSRPLKTVVRYDAPLDSDPAIRTVYLANSAAEALSQPDAILVTVTAG
jgi:hypothetical protein